MRTPLFAAVILFTATFITSCSKHEVVDPNAPHWQWKNEEEWLVSTTLKDVTEIVTFASAQKNGRKFAAKDLQFSVHQIDQPTEKYSVAISSSELPKEFKREFTFHNWLLEPDTYASIVSELLSEMKLSADTAGAIPAEEVVTELSHITDRTIYDANEKISKALIEHPLNADIQDEAAFLHVNFYLQDDAGPFQDYLHGMSRATAHLAIARALRGDAPSNVCGELAQIAVLAGAGRDVEGESLVKQSKLDKKLLDRFQWTAAQFRSSPEQEAFPVAVQNYQNDYSIWNHTQVQRDAIVADLNLTPTDCFTDDGTLQVVSWPDVADSHQRKICNGIANSYVAESRYLGRPQAADEIAAMAERGFSKLRLYPFAMDESFPDGTHIPLELVVRARDLIQVTPQLVPPTAWQQMLFQEWYPEAKACSRLQHAWYGLVPWYGSSYAFDNFDNDSFVRRLTVAEVDKIRSFSRMSPSVAENWIRTKYGRHPTGPQIQEGYGRIVERSPEARLRVARGYYDDPKEFIPRLEKIAQTDPQQLIPLAKYYFTVNKPEQAVKYLQLALDNPNIPSIDKANNTEWYAIYLYDKGKKQEAEALAQRAADVYSHAGLEAMARLREHEGKLDAAEEYFEKIEERYDTNVPLQAFHIRHMNSKPEYKEQAELYLKNNIPGAALVPDDSDKTETAPNVGVQVGQKFPEAARTGIKEANVLTSLNGYKIRTMNEFQTAKEMRNEGRLKLTFWDMRSQKYTHVDTPSMDGYIGIVVRDYKRHRAIKRTD
jgi:hypothetical protein